jgi:subtilase family serine protease
MMVHPDPATKGVPIDVRVGVENRGNAAAGSFTVEWWSSSGKVGCDWVVASLAPGEAIDLDCTYTYNSWSTYTVKEVVDSGNTVAESNEGNNSRQDTLVVHSP